MKYGIYFDYTGAGRGPEQIAGPFNTRQEAEAYAAEEGYSLTANSDYFIDVDGKVNEGNNNMEMLRELLQLDEAEKKKKKKVSKKAAHAVYHRDYVKTKKKPYRKYDPDEYIADKKD